MYNRHNELGSLYGLGSLYQSHSVCIWMKKWTHMMCMVRAHTTQDGYKPDEVHRCSSSRCALCPKLTTGSSFGSSLTGRKYQVVCDSHMSCDSGHVVYLISCRQCGFQYVGETSQLLRCRINQHRACIRRPNPTTLIQYCRVPKNGG